MLKAHFVELCRTIRDLGSGAAAEIADRRVAPDDSRCGCCTLRSRFDQPCSAVAGGGSGGWPGWDAAGEPRATGAAGVGYDPPAMFELGNNLREARQRRRIDLVIAEQDTKIRSKYLAALETEDFDVLPGPVFVRGFLRTYSRYLGLDPQLFIDEYNARFGRFEEVEEPGSPSLGRPGLAQERANRGRRTMRGFVIASLVALALIAWLGLRQEQAPVVETTEPQRAQPVTPEPTETASPEPDALDLAAKTASRTEPLRAADAVRATRADATRDAETATSTPTR